VRMHVGGRESGPCAIHDDSKSIFEFAKVSLVDKLLLEVFDDEDVTRRKCKGQVELTLGSVMPGLSQSRKEKLSNVVLGDLSPSPSTAIVEAGSFKFQLVFVPYPHGAHSASSEVCQMRRRREKGHFSTLRPSLVVGRKELDVSDQAQKPHPWCQEGQDTRKPDNTPEKLKTDGGVDVGRPSSKEALPPGVWFETSELHVDCGSRREPEARVALSPLVLPGFEKGLGGSGGLEEARAMDDELLGQVVVSESPIASRGMASLNANWAHKGFEDLDRDHKSLQAIRKREQREQSVASEALLHMFDSNADGVVQVEELMQQVDCSTTARMMKADKNKDTVIEANELRDFVAMTERTEGSAAAHDLMRVCSQSEIKIATIEPFAQRHADEPVEWQLDRERARRREEFLIKRRHSHSSNFASEESSASAGPQERILPDSRSDEVPPPLPSSNVSASPTTGRRLDL